MERTVQETRLARVIRMGNPELDRDLPYWARRSNPIIRRQLGMYWKTILPEATFLMKAFAVQAILIALTLPLPFLIELALPAITAAILLFPFALVVYGHLLLAIGMAAAQSITREIQNDTLTLLRATPFDLGSIIASKVAASIWRQVEDLGLLLLAAALMSMPLLISQYGTLYPLDENPLLARVAVVLGLGVSMLRLCLEPFMIGMIGVMMGAALRVRASAIFGTVIAGVFYFLFVNLLRLLAVDWPLRFVIDFGLPLLLPLLVSWVCFRLTQRFITQHF